MRLSLLAMFLRGQWEGGREEETMEMCNREVGFGDQRRAPRGQLGLGSGVQDTESKERLQDEVKVTGGERHRSEERAVGQLRVPGT